MTLTLLSESARNAACRAVVELVDRGSGPGEIRLTDAAGAVLLVVPLDSPGFGAPRDGESEALGLPRSGRGIRDGEVARFDVCDSSGAVAWSGTVTRHGGDGALTMRETRLVVGQQVSLTEIRHRQR